MNKARRFITLAATSAILASAGLVGGAALSATPLVTSALACSFGCEAGGGGTVLPLASCGTACPIQRRLDYYRAVHGGQIVLGEYEFTAATLIQKETWETSARVPHLVTSYEVIASYPKGSGVTSQISQDGTLSASGQVVFTTLSGSAAFSAGPLVWAFYQPLKEDRTGSAYVKAGLVTPYGLVTLPAAEAGAAVSGYPGPA
ncbi:MAG TPA: hypothetical protein VMW80_02515 [Candidatus Dormibacteraeota bacterium]|nr:hypothetical protein [Candidatus Dormibacteraeota bacterium]